ncbi:MAG: T9SS type A sorting domain-containing protein [Saprospiraceae bacterium]|nr:T9SS type A sorting domain-containing protein [Saprospiraceae bacterium]
MSDFRYKQTTIANKRVLIIEFRRVHLDLYYDEPRFATSDISFQYWFWENGDIEVRFGHIFIDESIFKPGLGCKRRIDPETQAYGPMIISIANWDNTEIINISGNLDDNPVIDYDADFDSLGGLVYIPQKNTVVRFKKATSATTQAIQNKPIPNLVTDVLIVPEDLSYQKYAIYDMAGRLMCSGDQRTSIDTGMLAAGYYVLKLRAGHAMYAYKFLKQ